MNTKYYSDLIVNTINVINQIGESDDYSERLIVAELYGIYYNCMAGLLRNKILFRKDLGKDGYPEIVISIGDGEYSCRASVLRDILKEDYERLTLYSYSDNSESYVKEYLFEAPESEDTGKENNETNDAENNSKNDNDEEEKKKKKDEERQAEAIARAKMRELDKAARKYKYDPNYDHFYTDRLPPMLKQIDNQTPIILAKIISIAASCVIAYVSFIYI